MNAIPLYPLLEPKNATVVPPVSRLDSELAWKVVEEFAGSDNMTLPAAEDRLKDILKGTYRADRWEPVLKAVMDHENDREGAVKTVKALALAAGASNPSVSNHYPPILNPPASNPPISIASQTSPPRSNPLFGKEPGSDHEQCLEADKALTNWRDLVALSRARKELTREVKNKRIDVIVCARITSMVASLNLYLDPNLRYGWREASTLAAKTSGHGQSRARRIRRWIHQYLINHKLPLHRYGRIHSSTLKDEDFTNGLQLHLLEITHKDKYIRAQDIVDYVALDKVQQCLGARKGTISLRTGQRWLKSLGYRYGRRRNGMYIDGHERADVVAYRKRFCERWKEYEKRMVTFDNEGNETHPKGFPVPQGPRFRLILVTHDESTFYASDRRKNVWVHKKAKAVPERKGEGRSFMISDFLTAEWGRLRLKVVESKDE